MHSGTGTYPDAFRCTENIMMGNDFHLGCSICKDCKLGLNKNALWHTYKMHTTLQSTLNAM